VLLEKGPVWLDPIGTPFLPMVSEAVSAFGRSTDDDGWCESVADAECGDGEEFPVPSVRDSVGDWGLSEECGRDKSAIIGETCNRLGVGLCCALRGSGRGVTCGFGRYELNEAPPLVFGVPRIACLVGSCKGGSLGCHDDAVDITSNCSDLVLVVRRIHPEQRFFGEFCLSPIALHSAGQWVPIRSQESHRTTGEPAQCRMRWMDQCG
jgi:hypothetical protein